MAALFFYGTLMVPAVLERVLGRKGTGLTTSDAVLDAHARFHVAGCDYPAVVSAPAGSAILGRALSQDEGSVRGSLVTGLTPEDVAFLDEFEGDEYIRTSVVVLAPDAVPAEVYLWKGDRLHRLQPSLWSFSDFMREKAHRWVGTSADKAEYAEVDRRRAMGGKITPPVDAADSTAAEKELPVFGAKFREQFWQFEQGWNNINHGSYGAAPTPVIKQMRELTALNAAAPDRWMRDESLGYIKGLRDLRARLGDFVGCDASDIVMVGNATTGVNAILRSLTTVWEKGDKFLYFSTTIYNACSASLQYLVDTHPHLELGLVPIQLEYPVSHAQVIAATKKAIKDEEARGGRIRLGFIDALSSNPGVIVPWEELTKIFREHNIISFTTADFWVSNCHKWLLGHAGCAVMYVAKKNQHIIHSIPIGHYYTIREPSPTGNPDWTSEFEWNGTIDWSPLLSINAALDFRAFCGGEKRITDYCHTLAIEGGELVAGILGTETMRNKEGEGELVANMINVRLPIEPPSASVPAAEARRTMDVQKNYLQQTQIDHYQTMAPGFIHAGKLWVRLSAQIYNDIEDFRKIGDVLKEVCEKIERGEHKRT
ncbi:hypothetical protein RQP46_008267 [Phenoliferia psychrophenolica]